jgi:hypothetical protein
VSTKIKAQWKVNDTQIFVYEVETQLREKPLRGRKTQEFHYSEDIAMLVFWPHYVFGQNHLYLRMLQTGIPLFRVKSEEFQSSLSAVRRIVPSRPDAYCSYFFRLDDVPSRPDTVSPASSIWTMCFFRPDTYTVSRSFCASLLRPDVLAERPDAYQFSNSSLILFKFQEREDQSTVRTRISVRQESQFKMNRPDI